MINLEGGMVPLVDEDLYHAGLYAVGITGTPPLEILDRQQDSDVRGSVMVKSQVGGIRLQHSVITLGTMTSVRVAQSAPIDGTITVRRRSRSYRRGLLDVDLLASISGSLSIDDDAVAHGKLEIVVDRTVGRNIVIRTSGEWMFCNVKLEVHGSEPTMVSCIGMGCKSFIDQDGQLVIELDPQFDRGLADRLHQEKIALVVAKEEAVSPGCSR